MALVSPRRSLHTSLGILTKKFLTTAGSASKCHITHTALIRSTFLLNVEIKAHVYHYFSAGLHSVSPTCSRCRADFWRTVRYRQALTMEFLPSSHFVIPVIPKIIPFLHGTRTGNMHLPTHPHTLMFESWTHICSHFLYYCCHQQFNTIEIIFSCMRSCSKIEENYSNYIFTRKCWSRAQTTLSQKYMSFQWFVK